MKKPFFSSFYNDVCLNINSVDDDLLTEASLIIDTIKRNNKGKVIIAGNGGSAAIASHLSIDLTKAANIRSVNFNESSLITCFANDYGYDKWLEKAIGFYADKGDVVILISSSGQSSNIINAAKKALSMNLSLITFSGFSENNKLNKLGGLSFWVDSSNYNVVETVHQTWLLSIVEYLIDSD